MRGAFRFLLERSGTTQVIGQARDRQEAVQLSKELAPDVILMDSAMPSMDGLAAAARAKMAGAYEFVLRTAGYADLVSSIAAILNGDTVFPDCGAI